jgi:phosphoadenosine phosphosulfate reductase
LQGYKIENISTMVAPPLETTMTTTTLEKPALTAQQATIAQLAESLARASDLATRMDVIRSSITGRIVVSTSLGIEDQAIVHAVATGAHAIDVFTLDTGRLFPETIETLAATEARYGVRIRVLSPDASATEALVARGGALGFRTSIDARKGCCAVRKVAPLGRGLAGATGWITGLRQGQSQGRTTTPFAEWDDTFGLIKINPLADWSLDQLEDYVRSHDIPINALHARGFPSIGCQPCTRAIEPGEDIRAGRWWWENLDGKECGLHNRPKAQGLAS